MTTVSQQDIRSDQAVLRFLAAPSEGVPGSDSVQAGHVLEWIDRAGFACAAGWSGSYCVTAYVGNVHFSRPIHVGDLVEAKARVITTGRTSMHVLVTIATSDPKGGERTPATHCLLVFVAVDADRRPRPVPQWTPRTVSDLDLAERAAQRIEARSHIQAAMRAQEYTDAGTAPRMRFRFLAGSTDVNWGGNVHGGTVMRWIDETSKSCATGWTGTETVGVYAGGIHFHRPIPIGHLVEVDSRIIHTGEHSVHVAARVRSADPRDGVWRTTAQCMSVFVVPGPDGSALPIAPMPLDSLEDIRLDAHARDLIRMRAELDAIGAEDALDA
jgi:acyl-CoA hydrolase